jgi:uncharacterized membrane protein
MRRWFGLLFVAGALVFTAAIYGDLPGRVPTHWNIRGEVDGWSSRAIGAFLLPLMGVVIWLVLRFLPRIDPRRENYARFRDTYDLVANALVSLMALVHVVVLGAALGWPISPERIIGAGVGVLFVLLGNVLPRARPTWFFGIRTPWTLTNDRVWERTHRLGGYLFVAAGLLFLAAALFPTALPGMAVPVAVAVLVLTTVVYSFVAWKQETSR